MSGTRDAMEGGPVDVHPPDAVRGLLDAKIAALLEAPAPERPKVLRAEQLIPPQQLLEWLEAQPFPVKMFWRDRSQEFETAAVGVSHRITGPEAPDVQRLFIEMRGALRPEHPPLRYYGGFAFGPHQRQDSRWDPFGAYHFVLSRFEILQRQDETRLVCNLYVTPDTDREALGRDVRRELQTLVFPQHPAPLAAMPNVVEREDVPGRTRWASVVNEALAAIENGAFQKVVLARESRYLFEEPLAPLALLRRLVQACTRSFGFYLQPQEDLAFLGATPERLYKRQSCYVQTEAIAGTRTRGIDPDADYMLGKQLLASDKDRREHRFVVESIENALDGLCRAVKSCHEPSLLKLKRCQHLFCALEGILKDHQSDADLLQALHPTPAVGGSPRQPALEWLQAHEPFDRRWFAAPVGWVSYDSSEFIVAIRSGLVSGPLLSLYTGAGIVPGSVAEEEWDELENKMSTYTGIFTGT
jgi:menaquinone-specific isochorismate synthase